MRQINPRLPSMILPGIRLTKYRGVNDASSVQEWTRIVPQDDDVRIVLVSGVTEIREVAH